MRVSGHSTVALFVLVFVMDAGTLLCRLWVGVWRQCVIHSYQGRSWSTTGTLQGTPAMQDGAALPTEPFLAELHLCVLRDYATSSSLV